MGVINEPKQFCGTSNNVGVDCVEVVSNSVAGTDIPDNSIMFNSKIDTYFYLELEMVTKADLCYTVIKRSIFLVVLLSNSTNEALNTTDNYLHVCNHSNLNFTQ